MHRLVVFKGNDEIIVCSEAIEEKIIEDLFNNKSQEFDAIRDINDYKREVIDAMCLKIPGSSQKESSQNSFFKIK